MAKLVAEWQKLIATETLQRSSHALAVVGSSAFIFGGELRPREPRDNHVHVVDLSSEISDNQLSIVSATTNFPSTRVGTAFTSFREKIYMFSGRGGIAMIPIDERGGLWEFNTTTSTWSLLTPIDTSPQPSARSYHCLASDGVDRVYLHAGCPESGRLSDLWLFSVSKRVWTQLESAPDPPRGGASIAFSGGRLYRMHGFDGKIEQGGILDVYSPDTNSWTSHAYLPDGVSGPTPRSVSALVALSIGGRPSLMTLFGEQDPSSLGHAGAGKMSDDQWVYDIADQRWSQVEIQGDVKPVARGWLAADVVSRSGSQQVVVSGGLGESNVRLDDVWVLNFYL